MVTTSVHLAPKPSDVASALSSNIAIRGLSDPESSLSERLQIVAEALVGSHAPTQESGASVDAIRERRAADRKVAEAYRQPLRGFVDLETGPDASGQYPEQSHTRLSPDSRQVIVATAEQVLPLLLVTYEPTRPEDHTQSKLVVLWNDPPSRSNARQKERLPVLPFYRMQQSEVNAKKPDDDAEQWWSFSIEPQTRATSTETKLILVIERDEKSRATSLQCAADLMRELQPTQTAAVLFDAQTVPSISSFGKVKTPCLLAEIQRTKPLHAMRRR